MKTSNQAQAWSREEFERRLRAKGAGYHIHHPYHVMMNQGRLSPEQVRGWVVNRFYYQMSIPLKDAAIVANCPDRAVRRIWIQRIIDHDGSGGDEGGIEAWLRLGEACGIAREEMWGLKQVLPGVRFAVDAYVDFARHAPWPEAVCSSLTELFAPTIHQSRLDHWPRHYPWIERSGYDYFRRRLSEARRDVDFALDFTLGHFTSRAQQERALEVLQFKLDVLWSMLDAMYVAYVDRIPTSAAAAAGRPGDGA